MQDKTSIPTARWHVYEAIHGKNNCIACMDQLQQTRQIEYNAKNLPEIFYSKSRAGLSHAMALHNCKQLQEWIYYNYIYKTSSMNISKICMDLSLATRIHSNKITAVTDLAKLLSP